MAGSKPTTDPAPIALSPMGQDSYIPDYFAQKKEVAA
jgi:hypothetical protein